MESQDTCTHLVYGVQSPDINDFSEFFQNVNNESEIEDEDGNETHVVDIHVSNNNGNEIATNATTTTSNISIGNENVANMNNIDSTNEEDDTMSSSKVHHLDTSHDDRIEFY